MRQSRTIRRHAKGSPAQRPGLRRAALVLLLVWAVVPVAVELPSRAADEPEAVVVQHILVAFKGSVRNKKIERTKKEARALAEELLERARSGDEEFGSLVERYTDDSYPGIYRMTNRGAPRTSGAFPREDMAVRFGDVAFRLEVGEVGLAEYSAASSPFGWHVIKRLE